jgi:superfamily II DNA/RNA helicase
MTSKDVAVQACTGSGKTLSFLIPIVEILMARAEPLEHHHVGAIIISPTRYGDACVLASFEHAYLHVYLYCVLILPFYVAMCVCLVDAVSLPRKSRKYTHRYPIIFLRSAASSWSAAAMCRCVRLQSLMIDAISLPTICAP